MTGLSSYVDFQQAAKLRLISSMRNGYDFVD